MIGDYVTARYVTARTCSERLSLDFLSMQRLQAGVFLSGEERFQGTVKVKALLMKY